ncbi:acetaldehyde dehydrogenase (acetylating) [Victivallis vadensis]|uniref:Acetaldehyde dehydrogenase n=1 Tax=Victivallis vadensis TaxID=172901 RepID=A0A848AYA5_9BACT|nr:acetaldehyde dehydrogenase (acetylating) [Victivallis vadensis]NMD85922.1 acetaldehyde dehydrogenase (acetylating) [Victivallis vadensis]
MGKKIKVAIIGTGNIGSDLLMKVRRSPWLECGMFAGRNLDSRGMRMAELMGVPVSADSIHAIESDPSCCEIVFDATSAAVHLEHAPVLKRLGKFSIDLTPSALGRLCVPAINLEECLEAREVNMITCGGQAAIPLAYAMAGVQPDASYCEVVASIASRSAGVGTRNNIDEFTQTTRDALSLFTGIAKTKAVIILNPAEPPVIMRNTVYLLAERPNMEAIRAAVEKMASEIRRYVPGYQLTVPPIYGNGRVTTTVEVQGQGDFLPRYSGNLDIITSAAVRIAEAYACRKLGGRLK